MKSSLIQQLIDELPTFRDEDGSLTADAAEVAAEELKTTLALLEPAKKALAAAQAGMTPEQRESLKGYEQSIFDKRKEWEALQAQLADDKDKLREIEVNIANAQREHAEIDASITSLRRSA